MTRLLTLAFLSCLVLCALPAQAQQSEQSRRALESAASKGSAPAAYALGAGAEAHGDLQRAVGWYQQAADAGYAAAQFKLGEMFEHGVGVEADRTRALDWYRMAAAQEFEQAVARLKDLEPLPEPPLAAERSPSTTLPLSTEPATADTVTRDSPLQSEPVQHSEPVPLNTTAPPPSTPLGIPMWDNLPKTTQGNLITAYIVISTVLGWLLMRPVIVGWFRKGEWFVSGTDVQDVFFKSLKMRLQVEGLALSMGALVGCFGGNLWFLISRGLRLSGRKPTPDAEPV